jgi:DNA-binding Xre family transcriptional regulator
MRKVRQMTQQQLADTAGLTRRAVALIEVSQRGIGLGEAAALCRALDVPLADMIAADPLVLITRTQVD